MANTERLSGRELEVVVLLISGFSVRAIVTGLSVSQESVRTYVRRAKVKLGATNHEQLGLLAAQ
jgi:DNA-binding CsgD family transcriptional regulator